MWSFRRRHKRGNYPYATARVKAKKSLLLTKDNYPKLLMMDLNEISRFLGETQYRTEMAELASKFSGVNLVETGTTRNQARVYRDILSFTKGELQEMVAAYLSRWDAWNIKTVLRGKFYGAPPEDIQEDLVPAGSLGEEYLNYLITLDTTNEILDEVRRKLDIDIPEDVMNAYEKGGTLAPLEDYLDKWYYSRLLETIEPTSKPKALFLSYIEREIDILNLRTLLKLKQAGLSMDRILPYLIEGGRELNMRELTRLAGLESFGQVVDELSKLSFYAQIKEPLQKAKETGTLSEVAMALQRYSAEQAEKFSHLYPLSVLPVVDYIIRKKIEVDNIRAIARGKESGLDPEVIKRLLVI